MVGYVNVNAVLGNRRNQAITSQSFSGQKSRDSGIYRNQAAREKARSNRDEGVNKDLLPHSYVAKFSYLHVNWIVDGPQRPQDPVCKLEHTTCCQHSEGSACELWPTLGALSFANETDDIILSKLFRYLSPSQGELPSKNLIMGTLAGDDEH
ncbi:hypothetical protein WN943_005488 [Citrus x changshan-huyou]